MAFLVDESGVVLVDESENILSDEIVIITPTYTLTVRYVHELRSE